MIAIDIETMGLHRHKKECPITMVCVYGGEDGPCESYAFVNCVDPCSGEITDADLFAAMKDQIVKTLNDADRIGTFNGVLFDLPFLADKFELGDDVLAAWVLKSIDLFYTIHSTTGRYCKMKDVLALNGFESKSADGLQAIAWAKTGNVALLRDYCMQDTVLTYRLCTSARVVLPIRVGTKPVMWINNVLCV